MKGLRVKKMCDCRIKKVLGKVTLLPCRKHIK